MTWTDSATWRAIEKKDLLERILTKKADEKTEERSTGTALSIRSRVKPVDFYAYLVGRFGEPNGLQSLMLQTPIENFPKPDSGNIIHWDFEFQSGETTILITGLSREIHVYVSKEVADAEWLSLIKNLKSDFGVFAKPKSRVQGRFEKWLVFANPFVALAEAGAGLHDRISEAQKTGFEFKPMTEEGITDDAYQEQLKAVADRANRIYADCLQLRMLTPVIGEAFINMLTALLAKPELKDDADRWVTYRKSAFHQKLENLAKDCTGFAGAIDTKSNAYKAFMRIRNKRNDVLHANVLPEQNALEVLYFDGKIPLYAEAGDIFQRFWENYERWVDPEGVLEDYENVHLFFLELESLLKPEIKAEIRMLLNETFPGYDQSRKRFGKLWPDHIVHFGTGPEFIRYDDQLEDGAAILSD
jgi:hypothetical protein